MPLLQDPFFFGFFSRSVFVSFSVCYGRPTLQYIKPVCHQDVAEMLPPVLSCLLFSPYIITLYSFERSLGQ